MVHGGLGKKRVLVYGMGRSAGWLRGNGAIALVEYRLIAIHLVACLLRALGIRAVDGLHLALNDVHLYRPIAVLAESEFNIRKLSRDILACRRRSPQSTNAGHDDDETSANVGVGIEPRDWSQYTFRYQACGNEHSHVHYHAATRKRRDTSKF